MAGVIDAAAGQVLHYEQGARVGTFPLRGSLPTGRHALRIGAQLSGHWRFEGLIDEVAVFRRALTPAEVAALYALGRDGRSLADTAARRRAAQ